MKKSRRNRLGFSQRDVVITGLSRFVCRISIFQSAWAVIARYFAGKFMNMLYRMTEGQNMRFLPNS